MLYKIVRQTYDTMPQELSDLHAWNSKPGYTNVNGRSQYTGEPSIGDLPTMVEQSTHIASNYAFRLPRQCCPQHCLSMQWIGDDMNHRRVGYVEIHRRPPLCVVVKVITRKWPVAWLLAPRTGLMEPSTAVPRNQVGRRPTGGHAYCSSPSASS